MMFILTNLLITLTLLNILKIKFISLIEGLLPKFFYDPKCLTKYIFSKCLDRKFT